MSALLLHPFSRALIAKIYCFAPITASASKIIHQFSGKTTIAVGIGILRIDLYRLVVKINCALIITFILLPLHYCINCPPKDSHNWRSTEIRALAQTVLQQWQQSGETLVECIYSHQGRQITRSRQSGISGGKTSHNSSIPNQRAWVGSSSLPTPSPLHTSCIEDGSTA